MAKYKVISISMSRGGHKKPAYFGDILTDADLVATGQNPHEMVSKGFLEVVESDTVGDRVNKEVEKVVEEKTDDVIDAVKANMSNSDDDSDEDSDDDKQPIFTTKGGKLVFDIDDCKKAEIIVELERRIDNGQEIEFSKADNKPVLWELL